LSELGRWFRCNRLTLNLKKTEYVYFAETRPPEVPPGGLLIDGEQVRRVNGSKLLEVWVDSEHKWRGHIDQVRRLLGVLGRARADLNEHHIVSLYNSMFLPHLQYCLMMWGNFEAGRNKAQVETLLKLQMSFMGNIA
jgi:hypothetical protein